MASLILKVVRQRQTVMFYRTVISAPSVQYQARRIFFGQSQRQAIGVLRAALLIATLTLPLSRGQATKDSSSGEVNDPQVLSTWRTAGLWNGRFWRTLPDAPQKTIFLIGYSYGNDTLAMAAGGGDFERYKQFRKFYWARTLTIAEVSSALDQFYSQPENGPIPISNVLHIISERAEGADEQTLQQEIRDMRSRASK